MRNMTKLPVFGSEHADCTQCELKGQCERGMHAHAYRPKVFNGLMIVGEGPGSQEVAEGRPFVGPSGKLLRAMLKQTGIDMDGCYSTNATLGKPQAHKKGFMEDFPHAVASCLPRLEAEIAAVRPRVILALGGPALIALTGYDKLKTERVAVACTDCDENRKVGPVLECQAPVPIPGGTITWACGYLHYFKARTKETVDPDELFAIKDAGCPKCKAKFKNVRPKMIKCPTCGGRKFKHVEGMEFAWDYNITDVAGAIFEPAPKGDVREPHQLGAWFAKQGVAYVVPSYHPAFILRDQQFLAEASLKHLAKVKRLLDGGKPRYRLDYTHTADPAVVEAFCFGWRKHGEEPPEFDVDIETLPKVLADGTVLDARFPPDVASIKVLGIYDGKTALVVDTSNVQVADPDDKLLAVLYRFLTDAQIPKCWHNGACYDIPVLDLVWGVSASEQLAGYEDDTLALHSALYPDEPHKLAHVAFSFTDAHAWKPARVVKGVEVHGTFEELALYNARDVYNTGLSRVAMQREIPTNKLQRVAEIDREMRRIGVEMTMAGMPVNLEKRAALQVEVQQKVTAAQAATLAPLYKLRVIDTPTATEREKLKLGPLDAVWRTSRSVFNPLSAPQLGQVLFARDGLGLQVVSYTKEHKAETKESVIHALHASCKDDDVRAFLSSLLEYRGHNKTYSNYFMSHEAQPWYDMRIHSFWQPWGTRTGRFSSKDVNQQNQPKWLRDMYEAPAGRRIVGADYDQLELRALGALCGDPVLIHKCMTADDQRKLEPEHDPHSFVASLAFGNTYTALLLKDPAHDKKNTQCKCQTCKRKALRDLIKRVIYGMNYGAGDETVRKAIYSKGDYSGPPIDITMIAHVRKTVFATFTHIAPWREEIVSNAQATCELRSPLHGRRRVFPLGDVSVTEAYNFPIQSIAADLINEKLIEFRRLLPAVDRSAMIVAQVHDAVYVECDEDRAPAVSKLLGDTLTCEIVLRPGAPAMRFSASGAIATNWKDAA